MTAFAIWLISLYVVSAQRFRLALEKSSRDRRTMRTRAEYSRAKFQGTL
jgi:hypothetical protein